MYLYARQTFTNCMPHATQACQRMNVQGTQYILVYTVCEYSNQQYRRGCTLNLVVYYGHRARAKPYIQQPKYVIKR